LTTFIDHRHLCRLGPSEPPTLYDLTHSRQGVPVRLRAHMRPARSITNQYRQKGARRRPPDGKDLAVRGGDPPLQGRASRRSHLLQTRRAASLPPGSSDEDEPSVEPQTSSLVKEQPTRLFSTAANYRRFSRRIVFPVEHGRVSRVLRRRTCPSSNAPRGLQPNAQHDHGSQNCESETPTGLRQPALAFPSPAPPVTFL